MRLNERSKRKAAQRSDWFSCLWFHNISFRSGSYCIIDIKYNGPDIYGCIFGYRSVWIHLLVQSPNAMMKEITDEEVDELFKNEREKEVEETKISNNKEDT